MEAGDPVHANPQAQFTRSEGHKGQLNMEFLFIHDIDGFIHQSSMQHGCTQDSSGEAQAPHLIRLTPLLTATVQLVETRQICWEILSTPHFTAREMSNLSRKSTFTHTYTCTSCARKSPRGRRRRNTFRSRPLSVRPSLSGVCGERMCSTLPCDVALDPQIGHIEALKDMLRSIFIEGYRRSYMIHQRNNMPPRTFVDLLRFNEDRSLGCTRSLASTVNCANRRSYIL